MSTSARRGGDAPGAEVPAVDVLVVGSGVAGLTTALEVLRLAPGARVAVATRAERAGLRDGATAWAQGGIAAVLPDPGSGAGAGPGAAGPADSVALHFCDTLAAGAGLCVADAVAVLCGSGAEAVAGLQRRGLVLDRVGGGADGSAGQLARGLEAAHSRPRVLHAGGDTTGAHVAAALGDAVRGSSALLLEGTGLVRLLQAGGAGSRVTGAELAGPRGERLLVRAAAVVLATGGYAQVYAHTTTPAVATGDGLVAAVRAGAVAADVEMVQFHPTMAVLDDPSGARTFLVSEAVRGAGAVLRDAAGHRFVDELAPRDVVARACAAAMAAHDGAPVLLDATAVPDLAARFPGITRMTREGGLDWTREPVPVTPAAHYAMGGVLTDLRGRTTVAGLWAAGEVASTGVHGANRLASNSLLEGAVFGARVAADVVTASHQDDHGVDHDPFGKDHGLPRDRRLEVELGDALSRAEVRSLTWEHAGLLRDAAGLELAAKTLQDAGAAAPGPQDAALTDAALTDVARLLVAGALARTESRGAHARTDHPQTDPVARRTLLRAAP